MCDAFAVLSATENSLINQSKLTSRNAAKEAVSYMMGCCNFTCENHKVDNQKFVNLFFNNNREVSIYSIIKEG